MTKASNPNRQPSTTPTEPSQGRPTIRSIADDLGVSVSTVSRVLNGKGTEYRIGVGTQERVKEAAAKINFSPNRVARGLRLRSSESIGLVVPDIANPFFASIARGVTDEARKHNYSLLLCDSRDDTGNEDVEIQLLQDRSVEGLIISPVGLQPEHLKQFESSPLATVLVDRYFRELSLPAVGCDNVASASQAIEYLIEHGHRRIACLAGLAGTLSNEDRIQGYRQTIEAAGITFDESIVVGNAFTEESGYKAFQELLQLKEEVTAIFATSSPSALGALRAIAEAGKSIPDDYSLIAFDDIAGAEFMHCPLTAIVQPVREIGRRAAEMLFSQIKGEKLASTSPVLLPTELLIRNSVKSIS